MHPPYEAAIQLSLIEQQEPLQQVAALELIWPQQATLNQGEKDRLNALLNRIAQMVRTNQPNSEQLVGAIRASGISELQAVVEARQRWLTLESRLQASLSAKKIANARTILSEMDKEAEDEVPSASDQSYLSSRREIAGLRVDLYDADLDLTGLLPKFAATFAKESDVVNLCQQLERRVLLTLAGTNTSADDQLQLCWSAAEQVRTLAVEPDNEEIAKFHKQLCLATVVPAILSQSSASLRTRSSNWKCCSLPGRIDYSLNSSNCAGLKLLCAAFLKAPRPVTLVCFPI